MNIYDFITASEMEALPEEPREAFAEFARIAQVKLRENIRGLDGRDENEWYQIQQAQYGFANVLIAAAKRLKVSPFSDMSIPLRKNFDSEYHDQFVFDLDHYLTQIVFDKAIRIRGQSLTLDTKSKDTIRSHLYHLNEALKTANLSDAHRARLEKKLQEFEAELNKSRFNMLAITWLTIEIMAIPGALWASADAGIKMLNMMTKVIAESSAADDRPIHLPEQPRHALAPPRIQEEKRENGGFGNRSRELDEEIPF